MNVWRPPPGVLGKPAFVKINVEVPVKSLFTLVTKSDVSVVRRIAVKSKPIVPTNVEELASVSTIGIEIHLVPSGEISTVLSNPSSVATNDEVDADDRKVFALSDEPFTSGIVLTDSVPKLKLELPKVNGFWNVPAVVGIIQIKEFSAFAILMVCVPTAKPSGWAKLIFLPLTS
jgi:hypothetical protein